MLKLSSKTYKKLINEASLLAKAKEWEHLKVWFSYWKDDDEMIYKCLIWGRFFLDNYFRDKSPDFHLEIIKRFFSDKNEYGAYPRGFAKTTLVQLCISFSVCNNLDEFIVLIEKTFTEASEVLSAVRDEFANNAAVLQVYGNMIKADKKGLETDKAKDTQGDVLINGVRLRAKGFNSPIRGLKSKEWRPTRIILDDIEQDDHINNIEQRQKYLDNFIKGVLPALEIGKTLKMFGTILHNDSLLMNLINEHKGLILKAYDKEDPENTLLWPERWSYPILEKKKVDMMMEGKGTSKFYQEFLNEALDDENRRFIWEWLQSSYATEDLKYKSTSRYVTIDPAESKKDGADWTAVTIVDWDSDNNWYIDYAKRYRVNSAELIDLIFTLWQEFKPSRIGIEKKAFEDQIKPYLNVKKSELGVFPIVVELEPHGIRKEDRIVGALQGRFESKKIHFKSGSNDDQKILKSELYDFPRAKNDDLCLSGDTLVVTINGNKKIKDIKIGDKVLTPTGVKKVLWSGCTGKKKVITNLGIIGTAEHKIFNGKSFDKLDTLTYNNHISEFNLLNQIIWKYKKLLYLMEFPTNLWVGRESIILVNQQLIKEEKILKDFMLQFGNFIIERKFQKGMLFTIKTVILLITTLITWNVYLMGNIYQSIGKKIAVIQNFLKRIKNIWKRYDHLQKNGINLKKEESGIEKNQKNNGLILNLQNWFVKNVKRVLPVLNLTQDSAIIIARCGIGEKGIQKNGIRLIREVLTREKVYNITVEDDGVFYANGILVSNCDALAYIEQLGSRPYSKDKKIPTSIAEEMKAVRGDERANNLDFLP